MRRPRGRPRKTADAPDDGNRRRELVAAAAHLFRQQGFAATSTRDIAAAAGMHSGSPFYHFDNKHALLAAVMKEGMESALQRQTMALAVLPSSAVAQERLRSLVRNHLDVLMGENSDFVPVILYDWRSLNPSQQVEISALKDAYEAAWTPVLGKLHQDGLLVGDPTLARFMIFGALNWTVQWYQSPSKTPQSALRKKVGQKKLASLDELTHAALQLFLKPPELVRARGSPTSL